MSSELGKLAAFFSGIKRVFYIGFGVIFLPTYFYMYMPIVNMWYPEFCISVIWLASIMAVVTAYGWRKNIAFKIWASIAVLMGFYMLVMVLATWSLFRAEAYRGLIGEIKMGDSFAQDIEPISLENIRIVDEDVAQRLGDKVLGEDMALGSRVEVGEYTIQKVGNELFWVAPLLHSGFFKWSNNSMGTPAYIMVSATNERDVRLVQKDTKGNPILVKYQPNGYFGDNLYRHLYFSGYFATGMTDFTFEVDDNLEPYWVVSLYQHKVGFSGDDVYGVVAVHATSGEIQEYTSQTAPAWIDRIHPKDIVKSQLDSWGQFVHGYWNFSNADKLQATSGISLVYGNNNQSYFYTGLTSVGADDGTVGFVLVNTRTKEATWYRQVGATEDAARTSAEGKVQEKGYVSSFPILYNINGIPTYVMSLKDRAGLIKMIAMVSVEDYSIVGVGENMKEALRKYKDAYNNSGSNTTFTHSGSHTHNLVSRIERINTDVTGGNSFYYFVLAGVKNKIFVGSSTVSPEIPLSVVNDSVSIVYEDGRTAVVDIVTFDNFAINAVATDSVVIK